jgi:hypothetical protein
VNLQLPFVFVVGSCEADETIMIDRPNLDDVARNQLNAFRQALLDAGKYECLNGFANETYCIIFYIYCSTMGP